MTAPSQARKPHLTPTQRRDLDQAVALAVAQYGENMRGPDFQRYVGITASTANNWRREGRGPTAYPLHNTDTPNTRTRWRYDTREVVAFVRGIQA